MEQKALKLIMAGLLILSMALTGREAAEYVGAMHAVNALRETGMGADDSGRLCVVVDAGHGGDDPGKIGINGAPEKDIDRKSTRLNSSHNVAARMPSSA